MPNVYNVSEITTILSGTIQKEDALQNVRVQGEVSVDNDTRVFWLTDGTNKIRCFIPGGKAQFGALLTASNTVTAIGDIGVFSSFSEYQISVNNVQPPSINRTFTVSEITQQLSGIIENTPELTDIHVRGKISELTRQPAAHLWFLKETGLQQIHCVFFGVDGMAAGNGDQVRIDGNIQIWGAQSRYQINIAEVRLDGCKCCGCGSCKKIAAAPQCSALPDPEYELCSACYVNSPDYEGRVEEAVETYFSNLKVKGFSPETQHEIQMGSDNRKPDVVLIDEYGSFAAIAECKGAGFIGDGIDQLKSYLSATDTRFGVFANRADPKHWEFYENRRRNRFDKINRPEFEAGVVEGITSRERLGDEIANLTHQIKALENHKTGLYEEIYNKLDKLFENKMQRLEKPLSDLKTELQKHGIVNWFKNLFSKENE